MKSFLKWMLTTALVCFLPSMVGAGYEEGKAAFEQGDYAAALKEFKALAEQNDPRGQYGLGVMYDMGEGVPRDSAEAFRWYRLAAEQGNADAQNNLGAMYESGEGVERDYGKAIDWYRLAAEGGNFDAPNNLGVMHMVGTGVRRDYVKAHMWLHIGGMRGDRGAMQNLKFLEGRMKPSQIAEARRLTGEWMKLFHNKSHH